MRTIANSAFIWIFIVLSGCASAPIAPYPQSQSSEQALNAMQLTRDQAAQQDKLAMYVLGANWCHDSTDFALLLDNSRVAPEIEQNYLVQYINVGYLDHIREFIDPYDVPVIYGTPTVMIVDPKTNALLNRASLPYWRSASSLNATDALHYFKQYSPDMAPAYTPEKSPALQTAFASIDQFERTQAKRIYAGYAALSPMMKEMEAGNPPSGFEKKWVNLAKMRSKITGDLEELRMSAVKQDTAGVKDIKLDFPSYALFID